VFDWKSPDYAPVWAERQRRLSYLRAEEVADLQLRAQIATTRFSQAFTYYKVNPWDFIDHWGVTVDPRNVERGLPALVPFLLFPRQFEFCRWVVGLWRGRQRGAGVKSRDVGFSWLCVSLACTLCLFNNRMAIGFGSRKLELVDKLGDPDCLFWKAREFMDHLPPEFTGGWTRADAPEKLVKFRKTTSSIKGEGGTDIGRGGRTAIYFVDEAGFLEHPELADASLSQTTNCQIDISTPHGMANPFYTKVNTWPPERVFRFSWRDDPRKDEAWYLKQVDDLKNPVVVAQEIDMDFAASVEGVIIPSAWLQACIDSHLKLNVRITGKSRGAFDVADEGKDLCSFVTARGILVDSAEEWSGVGQDIHKSTQKAFGIADAHDLDGFTYDADGMGAGARGAARVINEIRAAKAQRQLVLAAFRGSGEVVKPESIAPGTRRKNKDYFMNAKAQSWHSLMTRVYLTYRAVTEGAKFDPDEIISFSSTMPNLSKLLAELSQPTWQENSVGKMVVDKTPDGAKSPNLGDGVMMLYSPCVRAPLRIPREVVDAS